MPTLLLVDDSNFARKQIKRVLGDGYHYEEAADGLSGLEAYFLHHPQLVILDITMPGVNGLEVLEQLRQLDPQAQVLVCSADIQEFTRAQAFELGARGFIGKPIDAEDLRATVQAVLQEEGE